MGIQPKKVAKSFALDVLRLSHAITPDFVARRILRVMRIGFQPPSDAIEYPEGARAACCISIDFDATRPGRLRANHQGTEALVDLAEEYEVPITWAICGKTAEEDLEAYRMIVDSDAKGEIAIHTYSHVDVSRCSSDELEGEIEKWKIALGLDTCPKTFIFPWNRAAHFDTLKRLGFIAYRGADRIIGTPINHNGLWNVPPVYHVGDHSFNSWALIRRFIDFCITYSSVFHLWLHPWIGDNVVTNGGCKEFVKKTVEPVFEYLAEKRDANDIAVCTLGQLAEWFEERA